MKSYRVRELFNRFMKLMERDYKKSRDVNYYAYRNDAAAGERINTVIIT
ncbi:Uncharacterised protein [Segatella copri]|nr:Uncharacterised protein [Segatella copri]